MLAGVPSRTAYGAAVLRALHQDLDGGSVLPDPLAWRILGDRDQVDTGLWDRSRMRLFIAVRHRFAEDVVATAYARGVRQVVVLGAGLDTFAYRHPWPDLAVLEVDHPDTQAWKRELVGAAGLAASTTVTYVPVDFERQSLLDELVTHGFDSAAPASFAWLGVMPYLTHRAATETLRAIASVPGAEVVFDHTSPGAVLSEAAAVERTELEARVAEVGEPLQTAWEPEELDAVLAELGFDDVERLGRSEIRSRYLGKPALPADSRPGGGGLVRARRT